MPNIRVQQWYNGDPPRNLSGFLNDRSNRLIGWITMRQKRVQSRRCSSSSRWNVSLTCEDDYGWMNEETQSFAPAWQTTNHSNGLLYSSSIVRSFQYRHDDGVNGYLCVGDHGSYSSDGYVYEYRGRLSDVQNNISLLHQLEWIDSLTRAVMIEFSLYNPNVGLFTSVILLAEFLSTGGVYPQSRFEPLAFQSLSLLSSILEDMFLF